MGGKHLSVGRTASWGLALRMLLPWTVPRPLGFGDKARVSVMRGVSAGWMALEPDCLAF